MNLNDEDDDDWFQFIKYQTFWVLVLQILSTHKKWFFVKKTI